LGIYGKRLNFEIPLFSSFIIIFFLKNTKNVIDKNVGFCHNQSDLTTLKDKLSWLKK